MSRALLALLLFAPSAGAADLLVDFAPGGPKVVRVEVTLDGKPTGPLWEAAVGDLFKFFDRNADGKLDKAERERLTTAAPRRRGNAVVDEPPADFEFLGKLTFDAKADAVDRAGFAAALRAAGFGPVTITTQAGRAENPALTAALFKHLDADGDGTLSPAELKNARAALAPLDVNEDEWLTPAELLGRSVSSARGQVARNGRAVEAPPAADWLILQGDEAAAVAALVKRSVPKPGGKMTADEVTTWLRRPADLTITVALSSKPGESRVTPADDRPTPDGRRVTMFGDSGVATFDGMWAGILAKFDQTAPEGGLSDKALPGHPIFGSNFALVDRNADGVVTRAEAVTFRDAFRGFGGCRALLQVTDRGRALFDCLDTDDDGQLSPRELAAAAGRFPAGAAPGGVPRQVDYRVRCLGILFIDVPQIGVDTGRRYSGAPEWFARMDRNGDGDVSLREFLGPLDLFRKLDADGDGLISAAEALKR